MHGTLGNTPTLVLSSFMQSGVIYILAPYKIGMVLYKILVSPAGFQL